MRAHNGEVIEAGRRPGILARMLGSMLQAAREAAGVSYDAAAAQLGCEADWLIRAETGFAVAAPEEVARILAQYGTVDAAVAGQVIGVARRAAAPPAWLAAHVSRLTAAGRDVLLVEAEAALARVHGFRLIPELAQTQEYFRAISADAFPERDVEAEWDLLSCRQAHRPAGLARLLQVMIDESALDSRTGKPEVMAGQVRHLLALADSRHATVRVIPAGAPLWEKARQQLRRLVPRGHHRPDRRLPLPDHRRPDRLRRPVRHVGPHRGHRGGRPGAQPGHPRTPPGGPHLNHAPRMRVGSTMEAAASGSRARHPALSWAA